MFKNREVIKAGNGRVFSIMQFANGKWNLVLEYSTGGNRVFDTREDCLNYIEEYKKGRQ